MKISRNIFAHPPWTSWAAERESSGQGRGMCRVMLGPEPTLCSVLSKTFSFPSLTTMGGNASRPGIPSGTPILCSREDPAGSVKGLADYHD